jgi:hypothetical protein
MRIFGCLFRRLLALCFAAVAVGPATALAQSPQTGWDSGKWEFAATIYGWVPSVGGKMSFPVDPAGANINVDPHQILDSLKFTFMGSLDAHNGKWGAFTDFIYIDLGGNKSQTRDFAIGGHPIPVGVTADLNLDLKGIVWTLAGEYRVASDTAWKVDVLAGARYLDIKPTLGYSINGDLGPIGLPGRSGSKEIRATDWDGIVGVKGRYAFGDDRKWFVPFYLDVGTGQSDLTWQGAAGVGYSFQWGEVLAMWRYLDYNFKTESDLQELNFNGAMLGVTFHW